MFRRWGVAGLNAGSSPAIQAQNNAAIPSSDEVQSHARLPKGAMARNGRNAMVPKAAGTVKSGWAKSPCTLSAPAASESQITSAGIAARKIAISPERPSHASLRPDWIKTMREPMSAGKRKYGLSPGRIAAVRIANPDIQYQTARAERLGVASRETSTPTLVTPSASERRSQSG